MSCDTLSPGKIIYIFSSFFATAELATNDTFLSIIATARLYCDVLPCDVLTDFVLSTISTAGPVTSHSFNVIFITIFTHFYGSPMYLFEVI